VGKSKLERLEFPTDNQRRGRDAYLARDFNWNSLRTTGTNINTDPSFAALVEESTSVLSLREKIGGKIRGGFLYLTCPVILQKVHMQPQRSLRVSIG